ncbi:MAG TPA: hypothetical protein VFR84_02955 [Candidatus Angelobacter sp.]|nr:hypothetical protein [Candidatus Angelobacter sp.]
MKLMGIVLSFFVCAAPAQSPQPSPTASPAAAAAAVAPDPAQLEALVKQQFGATFTPAAKFSLLMADFDGDGVEDVAIVADSKDPIPDSYSFKYQIADPYHAYFGMGDPRFSAGFRADPGHSHNILIIFGNGKDAWHAATPKAKFVLINVPFDSVEVGRMLVSKKKPPIYMIKALEARIMDSAIWWDAKKKKWKWEPGDTVQ